MRSRLALLVLSGVLWHASAAAAPGELDVSFGVGGIARVTTGNGTLPFGIQDNSVVSALQSDGKALVFENLDDALGTGSRLRRYGTDGSVDATFGTGGVVAVPYGPESLGPGAIIVQPDGTIVLGSTSGKILRFLSDGTPDASFGTGGVVDPSLSVMPSVRGPDGRLIGAATVNSTMDFGVARYNADGSADTTFGSGGLVVTDLGHVDQPSGVVVLPDNRIVVAGTSSQQGSNTLIGDLVLVRYDTSGALDPSFGTGGIVKTDISGNDDELNAVVLQPDGKIVVGGSTLGSLGQSFLLARYDTSGVLDPGFGTGGLQTMRVNPGMFREAIRALALQPDGKIVAAGLVDATAPFESRMLSLARYDSAGALDPTFGNAGVHRLDFFGIDQPAVNIVEEDTVGGIALLPDRKLVLGSGFVLADNTIGPSLVDRFGFSLVRLYGGTCGDTVVDGGEECDDGNTAGADGCSAICCTADTDGDGLCDSFDPCAAPGALAKASLIADRLQLPPDDERLSLQGQMALPFPFNPPLDPSTNGVRIMARNGDHVVLDVTIPGGALGGSPAHGWKRLDRAAGSTWTYIDKRTSTIGGIVRVVVTSANSGLVKFSAKGKKGDYERLGQILPAGATFLLAPTQCTDLRFPGPTPAPHCAFATPADIKLVCK